MADKREVFEGRDWLFNQIAEWQATGHSRALLIRADFGVGKTAVMAELVHRNTAGVIAAWHFCQHDTQETLQPGAFVRSLAAQLAATLPGYKALVDADAALQQRLDGALTDPGSALEGAVLAPLARLPAPPKPRLLVVDALDEALELDPAAARRSGTIISLLAAKAARFPSLAARAGHLASQPAGADPTQRLRHRRDRRRKCRQSGRPAPLHPGPMLARAAGRCAAERGA